MELVDCNLTQLLERMHIIMYVKLSILQDVSRGYGPPYYTHIYTQSLFTDSQRDGDKLLF